MSMPTNERELEWEGVILNDSPEFILLPEGDYPFKVEGLERSRHGGSEKLPPCNKVDVKIRVYGATGEVVITRPLFLHSKMEGFLCAFFLSIGLRKHGEPLRMNWNIIGATGTCHVNIDTYAKRDGSGEGKSNKIARFLDPADAPQQLAFEAQAQAQAKPQTYSPGNF